MGIKLISIEIAYASLSKQCIIHLDVMPNTTILDAILRSDVLTMFPEIDLTKQKIGVFSQLKKLTDIVQEGDRIEIYRPLTMDPKEGRRARLRSLLKRHS